MRYQLYGFKVKYILIVFDRLLTEENKLRKVMMLLMSMVCLDIYASVNETAAERTITRINSYRDYAVIYFSPSYTHVQDECLDSKSRAIIKYEEEGGRTGKEMYALALTAATTGNQVGLAIYGCYGSHPKIYRVDVNY